MCDTDTDATDAGTDTEATDTGATDTDDTGGDEDVVCVPEDGEEPMFPSFDRTCDTIDDCDLVFHTVDCCGNAVAWGIRADEVEDFNDAEAICDSQYPDCGCPMGPVVADDGNAASPQLISVDCQMGVCWSYVV